MSEIRSISIPQWCELVRAGHEIPVHTLLDGVSMLPLIRRNQDTVTIMPIRQPLQIGDVVLFTNGRKYIVHRIWKIDGDGSRVQTLGDNCIYPDAPVPRSQVLGIAVQYVRNGRTYRLDTPGAHRWGRFWMAILPLRRPVMRLKHFVHRVMRFLKRRAMRICMRKENDN